MKRSFLKIIYFFLVKLVSMAVSFNISSGNSIQAGTNIRKGIFTVQCWEQMQHLVSGKIYTRSFDNKHKRQATLHWLNLPCESKQGLSDRTMFRELEIIPRSILHLQWKPCPHVNWQYIFFRKGIFSLNPKFINTFSAIPPDAHDLTRVTSF